jgi:hypothetical protein
LRERERGRVIMKERGGQRYVADESERAMEKREPERE